LYIAVAFFGVFPLSRGGLQAVSGHTRTAAWQIRLEKIPADENLIF
jgi:hypothetical protein